MRDYMMGAATPVALFDPMLTFEIIVWGWLAIGMFYATIGLVLTPSARAGKPTSAIIAAWCVVSLIAPGVLLIKACRRGDDDG